MMNEIRVRIKPAVTTGRGREEHGRTTQELGGDGSQGLRNEPAPVLLEALGWGLN
jgi:hypothetical protein